MHLHLCAGGVVRFVRVQGCLCFQLFALLQSEERGEESVAERSSAIREVESRKRRAERRAEVLICASAGDCDARARMPNELLCWSTGSFLLRRRAYTCGVCAGDEKDEVSGTV